MTATKYKINLAFYALFFYLGIIIISNFESAFYY